MSGSFTLLILHKASHACCAAVIVKMMVSVMTGSWVLDGRRVSEYAGTARWRSQGHSEPRQQTRRKRGLDGLGSEGVFRGVEDRESLGRGPSTSISYLFIHHPVVLSAECVFLSYVL